MKDVIQKQKKVVEDERQVRRKDLDKKKFYEEKGYNVNIKWESEWVEDKKIMKKNNVKWF